jgi:organic radical activating enzyme
MSEGWLVEVFPSFQGEGLFIGQRQLFIRFAGCNRRCAYCDSRHTWRRPARVQLCTLIGRRCMGFLANPLCLSALLSAIDVVEGSVPRDACRGPSCDNLTVSLSGGEPLLQAQFLRELLPLLRARRMQTYLETNGSLPGAMQLIATMVDVAAIDVKIPSATRQPLDWGTVAAFARAAAPVPRKFFKLVLTASVKDAELARVRRFLERRRDVEAVILQPVTPVRRDVVPLTMERLECFRSSLSQVVSDVRVIPQVHRLAAWR